MIDHVQIRVCDREASERFYTTVFNAIGKPILVSDDEYAEWGDFSLIADGRPVAKNLHIAFWVPSTDLVDTFHATGIGAGYEDDGAPGARPRYGPDYYGGFLRDPDGNSVEAVTSEKTDRRTGALDHLWLRSPNLQAAKAFYETIGPFVGVGLGDDEPDRLQLLTDRASLSFVTGSTFTEHVHIAFAADTNEQVEAFHQAATQAGYTDNGAPGERAVYHPGYYGAFVLDPDGHNIEAVNHNRP